jgi:hypothetical protein
MDYSWAVKAGVLPQDFAAYLVSKVHAIYHDDVSDDNVGRCHTSELINFMCTREPTGLHNKPWTKFASDELKLLIVKMITMTLFNP